MQTVLPEGIFLLCQILISRSPVTLKEKKKIDFKMFPASCKYEILSNHLQPERRRYSLLMR